MELQNIDSSYTKINSSTNRTSVINDRQKNDDLSVPKDPAFPKGPIGSQSMSLEKIIKQGEARQAELESSIISKKDPEKATKDKKEAAKLAAEENKESLEKAKELIAKLSLKQLGLSFKIDKDLNNRTLISVKDKATDDVVRQIPSEEFVRMAKAMSKLQEAFEPKADKDTKDNKELLKGLIFDNLV